MSWRFSRPCLLTRYQPSPTDLFILPPQIACCTGRELQAAFIWLLGTGCIRPRFGPVLAGSMLSPHRDVVIYRSHHR
ncbi:hypothetical protein HanIR_Chr17g0898761 [Helianthus annuus]|nr:hypothetical protein HanIR_Chr17g0898761 [Helianthus annuus]